MTDFPPPPCDFGWFTLRQYEHLINVVGQPGGMAAIVAYCAAVRERMAVCRLLELPTGRVVRTVMAQTRAGFPGIDQADLLPITRGILNAIFEEQTA